MDWPTAAVVIVIAVCISLLIIAALAVVVGGKAARGLKEFDKPTTRHTF